LPVCGRGFVDDPRKQEINEGGGKAIQGNLHNAIKVAKNSWDLQGVKFCANLPMALSLLFI